MAHSFPIARCPGPLLLATTLLLAGTRPVTAQTPPVPEDFPRIQVQLEQVDTTNFPRIRIRFRVLDTNPETEFKELTRPDVKIRIFERTPSEPTYTGPALKPEVPQKPEDDGIRNPECNELATSFVVDRSASITSVLYQIGEAIKDYSGKLKVDHNGNALKHPLPDIMNVFLFSGASSSKIMVQPYTDSQADVTGYVNSNFTPATENGTPYYNALEMALAAIKGDEYLRRTIILISDGRQAVAPLPNAPLYKLGSLTQPQLDMMGRVEHLPPDRGVVGVVYPPGTPGHPNGTTGLEALNSGNQYLAERLGERADGLKVPLFALGFSRIEVNKDTGQFARVRILEQALKPLANAEIGGAFFRPRSPLPEIPDFPGKKPWVNETTPPTYSDAEKSALAGSRGDIYKWVMDVLSITKNVAEEVGGLDGDLPPALKQLEQSVIYAGTGSYGDLRDKFADGLPELQNTELITVGNCIPVYNEMVQVIFQAALDNLSGDNGILNTTYYGDLSNTLFRKIRYSLKNTFFIDYVSPSGNDEAGPAERFLKLQVSYVSRYKGRDEPLTGFGEAPFKKPVTIPEDSVKPVEIPLTGSQPALMGMVRDTNPRGGPWSDSDGPTLKYKIALWAQVDQLGSNPVNVQLAEKDPATSEFQLAPRQGARQEEIDAFNRLMSSGDQRIQNLLRLEMSTYLDSARFYDTNVDTADPLNAVVSFKAQVPTPSLSPAEQIRVTPPLSDAEPKIKKLWYFFNGWLERSYEFNGTNLVRFDLPAVKFEVSDRTMPTVAVRFESDAQPLMPEDSDAEGISHIYCREIPYDKEKDENGVGATYEYRIRGPNFVPDVDIPDRKLKASPTAAGIELEDPDATIPGYFVKENTRLRIQVLAKDNFMQNYDHLYLLNRDHQGNPNPDPDDPAKAFPPFSNRWDDEAFAEAGSKGYDPPFLSRADWANVQGDTTTGGITWRLVQDGEVIEEVPDTFTFRTANYDPPNIGKPYVLEIKASDGNPGNLNEMKIPIWVVPQDFNIDVIRREIKVEFSDYKQDGRGL